MAEENAGAGDTRWREYLQLWADSFAQVITQITGAPVLCRVVPETPAELRAAAEAEQWVTVTSAGGLRGEMSVRLAAASVLRLGQAFMSEPAAPDAPLTADHKESVIELLRQVSGIVASGAKARWGEVQLHLEGATAAPSWAAAESLRLEAGAETPPGMVLEIGLSAALVAELRAAAKSEPAKTEEAKAGGDSAAASTSAVAGNAGASAEAGTLDLLMDVQLALSMRFGSRRLLLREVLDLSPGAVVELDRRVQEPVDLLLDGKLVARGEVVVIDGNYGLRVSAVSPQALPAGRRDG